MTSAQVASAHPTAAPGPPPKDCWLYRFHLVARMFCALPVLVLIRIRKSKGSGELGHPDRAASSLAPRRAQSRGQAICGLQ